MGVNAAEASATNGWPRPKVVASGGRTFTDEQLRWLHAIRDHIATSVRIERDDFYDVPFAHFGGLGRAHELFGDQLDALLDELNARLAA